MKNVKLWKGLIIITILSAFLLPICSAAMWTEEREVEMVVQIVLDIQAFDFTINDLYDYEQQKAVIDKITDEILIGKYNINENDFFIGAMGNDGKFESVYLVLDLAWDTYEFTFKVNKIVEEEKSEI